MKHAVVIGGGVGGLLAARVLSDHFEKVTVLERDIYPGKPVSRKTIPQGNHLHILLSKGISIIEKYFPGIIKNLQDAGENYLDASRDIAWFFHGAWRPRNKSDIKFFTIYRPCLDWILHERVIKDCPRVTILEKCVVNNLLTNPEKTSVTGVHYTNVDGKPVNLNADLVVDSSGRTSQTPQWLVDMGYQPPNEKEIVINVTYTTRIYNRPATFNDDWSLFISYPEYPKNWRAGSISEIRDNQWMVTQAGYFGDHAATDDTSFLEFAKTTPRLEIYNLIKNLKPISETILYKIPRIRRRFYEKLSRFPDGLVVIGDANCVFNPVFGQGISAASLYVEALKTNLEIWSQKHPGELTGLSSAFQKSLPKALDLPWFLTNLIDLSYPQTIAKRPFGVTFFSWFFARTLDAVSRNPRLHKTFLEIMHLEKGVAALINPAFTLPVLFHGIKSFFVPLQKRANTGEIPRIIDNEK